MRLLTTIRAGRVDLALLATLAVYAVLAYVLNVMFFSALGDSQIKGLMVVASLLCLALRWQRRAWGAGGMASLLYPALLYTAVLLLSYLINDGFMSTINSFLVAVVFLYCAAVVRLSAGVVMGLCLIAAVEVVLLMVFGVGRAQWGGRLGGFTNPIFLGMFTCSMSVLCAYLAAGNGRARLSMALWLAALAFLTATLMTQSRGVAIAYLLLVPLLLYFLVRNRLGSVRLGVTLLVALVLILSWAATSETTRDRFYETQQEVGLLSKQENSDQTYLTSMGFRILLWRFSLAVAAEHPLFGVGDERFQQLKKAWSASGRFPAILSEHQPTTHAHNQYLQELAMRGVVGLAALLTLLIAPAVKGVRLMRSGRIGQARCGALLLSLTLAFAVFSLTEVALKHPEKIILFVVVGFIALRLSQERQPVIDDHADEHRRGGCG